MTNFLQNSTFRLILWGLAAALIIILVLRWDNSNWQELTPEQKEANNKAFCEIFGALSIKDIPAMCLKYVLPGHTDTSLIINQ